MAPGDDSPKRFHWRARVNEALKNWNMNPVSTWLLIGLAAFGLLLLFWGREPVVKQNPAGVEPGMATPAPQYPSESVREQRRLEAELRHILTAIDGAGTVAVKITLQSGGRKVWERQSRSNKRTTKEQGGDDREEETSDELVLAKDGNGRDSPVLKEELAPEIQGVIVVASGARQERVREMLTNAVMGVLDLPAYRVIVVPGEVKKGGDENE